MIVRSIRGDHTDAQGENKEIFDLLLLNIQGLKQDKIDSIIIDYCLPALKFVCLTETWCVSEEIAGYNIEGFSLGSNFCRGRFIRGGVALWYRDELECRHVDILAYCHEMHFECAAVEWSVNRDLSVYIILCYRSLSGNFDTFFGSLNSVLSSFIIQKNLLSLRAILMRIP